MTDDKADFDLLSLANEKGKFALALGGGDSKVQGALERGFDGDWFRLIDVSTVAHGPSGMLMRIFKLTPAGWRRRAELKDRMT
jgi:hypothetical protein